MYIYIYIIHILSVYSESAGYQYPHLVPLPGLVPEALPRRARTPRLPSRSRPRIGRLGRGRASHWNHRFWTGFWDDFLKFLRLMCLSLILFIYNSIIFEMYLSVFLKSYCSAELGSQQGVYFCSPKVHVKRASIVPTYTIWLRGIHIHEFQLCWCQQKCTRNELIRNHIRNPLESENM